jgi:alpha-1,2-glucosyltransferase
MISSKIQNNKDSLDWYSLSLLFIVIIACLILGFNTMMHLPRGIGDENVHKFQIMWFVNGHYEFFKNLTMPPFYHAIIAILAKIFGSTHNALRAEHLVIASFSIPVFYRLSLKFSENDPGQKTLQFFFLPILFPLFFLIYTDILSIIFVLITIERTLSKKYIIASCFGLLAVLTRQPNIIWVAYAFSVAVLQEVDIKLIIKELRHLTRKLWSYLVVFLTFIVFVIINKGIALGDASQHPISLNLSNLYFFLLVAFFLFLPLNIEYSKDILKLIWKRKWLIGLIIITFAIYYFTYGHPHKYNSTALSFYRHNLLLHYSCDYLSLKIISFILMWWMVLTFSLSIKNSNSPYRLILLIPFSLFSIVPLPLIEQRYYLITLILFIAFNPKQSKIGKAITLLWYICLINYFLYNISHEYFFL